MKKATQRGTDGRPKLVKPGETRDATTGRFKPGNTYAACKHRMVGDAIKRTLYSAVSPADVQAVVAKVLERAKAGNFQCAQLVLKILDARVPPGVLASQLDSDTEQVEADEDLRFS